MKGKGSSRNMYKGHMDEAKGVVGLRVGGGDVWKRVGVAGGK